jgi:ribosome recycling factor
MPDILGDTKAHMQQILDHFRQDLKSVRAGRASPGLIEPIHVEVYGTQMRIKDVANISSPEPRQLLITPFDASNVHHCARAIDKANLGVTCVVEGKTIRVIFPELDQARRKDLITQCHKKLEETKISIRNIRRDTNEKLKEEKSSGRLREDEHKRDEKQVQELTDKACKDADEICSQKEKEIMSI